MKRLHVFFLSLLILTACNSQALPEGVLDERKMVNVLVDMHIIDGYISTLMYSDSLRMEGKNYYATIYKNHNISKAVFDKSMKYYSTKPVLLDSMYSRVVKILDVKEKRLTKLRELEQKKLTQKKLKESK